MDRPFTRQARTAGDDQGAHAVTFVAAVLHGPPDAEYAVPQRHPASNGGVLQIVPRVAAGGAERHPAKLGVRQFLAALPGVAGEVRQGRESLKPFGLVVELPVAVLPGFRLHHRRVRIALQGQQELPPQRGLVLRGRAAEGDAVQLPDAGFRRRLAGDARAGSQPPCLLLHEGAVQQIQTLLRHRRLRAHWRVGVGVGEVEGAKEIRQVLSVDEAVERAAQGGLITRQQRRLPAHGSVELAGDEEERIAKLLKVQPAAMHPPVERVGRIDLRLLGVHRAALLVGVGEHDDAVKLLDRPAVFHEVHRQEIEQLRVRGPFPVEAKITGAGHQRHAEMMHPNAVHHHPGGERILPAGDLAGHLQPAAALGEGLPILPLQHPEVLAGHLVPAGARIAA